MYDCIYSDKYDKYVIETKRLKVVRMTLICAD